MRRSHEGPRLASVLVRAGGLLAIGALTVSVAVPGAGAAGVSASQRTQAKQSFLVKSDLPNGWKSIKNTISNSGTGLSTGDSSGNQQLASCLGVPLSLIKENPPSVIGPEFTSPNNGLYSVAEEGLVFRSTTAAKSFLSAVASAKLTGCMQSLAQGPLKSKLLGPIPNGVTFGAMTVSAPPAGSLPANTAGITIEVPLTDQGATANVTATQVIAIKGTRGQEYTFVGAGTPFPSGLENHLVSVSFSRL